MPPNFRSLQSHVFLGDELLLTVSRDKRGFGVWPQLALGDVNCIFEALLSPDLAGGPAP